MQRFMRLGVCSSLVLIMAIPAFATTYIVPSDQELVSKSEAIAIAVADQSETVEGRLGLETLTRFLVMEGIKGVDSGDEITVAEPGGVKGRKALYVEGAPRFETGDRVLLFLSRDRGRWTVTDYALGHFRFKSKKDGTEVLVRAEGHIVGWDVDGKVHEEKLRDQNRFLQFIRSVVAGRSVESDNYLVSGDPKDLNEPRRSRIIANVVPFANSTYTSYLSAPKTLADGCAAPVEVNCPWPASIGNRWRETTVGSPAGSQSMPGGVTFFKTATQNLSPVADGGVAAIQAGLAAWNDDIGSSINLLFGTTPPGPASNNDDSVNVVEFNDPQGRVVGSWIGSGLIAITFSAFNEIDLVNGEYWWFPSSADVVFQDGYLSTEPSLNSAMTHELGHAIGMRHSDKNRINNAAACNGVDEECSSSAIMIASSSGAGFGNTLQTWDRNAAAAVYPPVCNAPTNVTATATSASSVSVSWTAATGATQYEVLRGTLLGNVAVIGSTASTNFPDNTASAGVTYIYRVRTICGVTPSSNSGLDIATTIVHDDDALSLGNTLVKAVHLAQLRQAVTSVRAAAGLSAASVTDSASVGVVVRAVHITELRTALDAAMTILGLSTGGYTDSLSPGATLVRAVHFQELRTRTK